MQAQKNILIFLKKKAENTCRIWILCLSLCHKKS